ncbi:hypothetical protein [Magnetospira sp. QH-2]|uniref:hypothetical protein n=1 Tax=Magnetospira sp. (strain QH-2) TaxID=1288970 RepID=UPI0003E81B7C|nr:hypothetical protein [Magnetospira sp. QH-2]CCQ72327.1 protein of unknown function [Magnetospira sp. QH-2]
MASLAHTSPNAFQTLPDLVQVWSLDARDHGIEVADQRSLAHSGLQAFFGVLGNALADLVETMNKSGTGKIVKTVNPDEVLRGERWARDLRDWSRESRRVPGHHRGRATVSRAQRVADLTVSLVKTAVSVPGVSTLNGMMQVYDRELTRQRQQGVPEAQARHAAAIDAGVHGVVNVTAGRVAGSLTKEARNEFVDLLGDVTAGMVADKVYEMYEEWMEERDLETQDIEKTEEGR